MVELLVAAVAAASRPCVVPRVYTLSPAAAAIRIERAGCTLGAVVHELPWGPRVTGQVPLPGAILTPRARVSLVVGQ